LDGKSGKTALPNEESLSHVLSKQEDLQRPIVRYEADEEVKEAYPLQTELQAPPPLVAPSKDIPFDSKDQISGSPAPKIPEILSQ
jgi:hypothetical protein